MGDARVKTFGLHPLAALGVALLLSACAAKPPPKPASVTGTVEASAQVNPSASKRPSPLLIRIYELKSAATFNAADFMSLYQRDQAELGGDLLAKEEFVLNPGETKTFAKTLAPTPDSSASSPPTATSSTPSGAPSSRSCRTSRRR
jgi:type VI secretion system VasD/TssJ family lipoprotein